jgi:prepilin signal peptidase PulO-like enzyme (type II secretory pathway)
METYIYYFFVFIAGTFIGSFLNVVADRLISGEPIINDRSHCDKCKKPLGPQNLIPIISFLWQRGECTNCHTKLSWFYPVSEILTGLLFAYAFYFSNIFKMQPHLWIFLFLAYLLILFSHFIVLILADAKYQLVPDVVVYSAIITVILFTLVFEIKDLLLYYNKLNADDFGKYLLQAGIFKDQLMLVGKKYLLTIISTSAIAFFFWFLVKITKERGMGYGDIGLGILIGVFNGFPLNMLAVFLGFLFGSVISLALIVIQRKTIKDTIAFGPFLLFGSIVALGWGERLVRWYLGIF